MTKFSTEQFSLLKTRGPCNEEKIEKCKSWQEQTKPLEARKAGTGQRGSSSDQPEASLSQEWIFLFCHWVATVTFLLYLVMFWGDSQEFTIPEKILTQDEGQFL